MHGSNPYIEFYLQGYMFPVSIYRWYQANMQLKNCRKFLKKICVLHDFKKSELNLANSFNITASSKIYYSGMNLLFYYLLSQRLFTKETLQIILVGGSVLA